MANYTIKDLENLSGIKAHTIRIWEKRYKLVNPERTATNIRLYNDNDLKKLLNISILNRNGVKISKIAQMQESELSEKINIISQNASDSESQIERLSYTMIEMDEDKFDEIISKSIFQIGFEETFINIVYPFFVRIGVMWQTGTINPAQEHFITNIIRQKLLVAIDGQKNKPDSNTKKFLIFLPEGELHELGILFYSYLIQKRGHRVIYLGQSVPFKDVIEVNNIRETDFLVTSFFSTITPETVINYVNKLSEALPKKGIFISGGYTAEVLKTHPKNVKLVADPEKFIKEIDKLAKPAFSQS
jgi:DNA-binding transcriptional MerR regulator